MKKIVLLGAGQMGKAAAALLNDETVTVLAFGDNHAKGTIYGIPVYPVADTVSLQPDSMVITVRGPEREVALQKQVRAAGFTGQVVLLREWADCLDIRKGTLLRLARRLQEVPGAIAELGVYQGQFAALLNALFADRTCYLFDTFSGFHGADIATEQACRYSTASVGDFADTSVEMVLARMPRRDRVVIRQGYFPDTAAGLSETFALVSLDTDLYTPTLAGLEWFLPRIHPGGAIILHDWDSARFRGVGKAVEMYERQHGRLPLVPLGDLHGTAVIIAGNP